MICVAPCPNGYLGKQREKLTGLERCLPKARRSTVPQHQHRQCMTVLTAAPHWGCHMHHILISLKLCLGIRIQGKCMCDNQQDCPPLPFYLSP